MADWADLHDGTELGHRCTFCKRPMRAADLVASPQTGRPYCADRFITECNRAYGKNAGTLKTDGWKLVPVG